MTGPPEGRVARDDPYTIGLVGYGRINRALHEYVEEAPEFEVEYVYVRSDKAALSADIQSSDPETLATTPVDLCVEGATPEALTTLGEDILEASDLMVLSGSAFVDPGVEDRLIGAAQARGRAVYLPHAALFGLDGLMDARSELESVSLEATKAPDHLDFAYTDTYSPEDVDGRTVLYEGPVRGLCEHFPRNFNSHAAVALASLGLDETTSRLIADPEATTAHHEIRASGRGFDLEVVRDSDIEGVTGQYTLVSVWGSLRRAVIDDRGLVII